MKVYENGVLRAGGRGWVPQANSRSRITEWLLMAVPHVEIFVPLWTLVSSRL